jgi:uncharacterized coiled-coil protein SlyX
MVVGLWPVGEVVFTHPAGPSSGDRMPLNGANAATKNPDEFLVVDCLLPGRIKKLGKSITYMTARRAIRTSARDCEIRGGEYTSFDRASYASSFKVWLEPAKEGDPLAQTYLGELYEKGLGVQPDYTAAVEWYRRAANQGHAPAMINLAALYERGLGVTKDPAAAMNWYRRASGLDDIILQSSASGEIQTGPSQQLQDELEARSKEVELLRRQIQDLQDELDRAKRELEQRQGEIKAERESFSAAAEQLNEERHELDQVARQLAAEREYLLQLQSTVEKDSVAASDVRRLLEELKEREILLANQAQTLAEREARLAEKNKEIRKLEAEVRQLQIEVRQNNDQIAALESVETKPVSVSSDLKIEILDPKIQQLRNVMVAQVRSAVQERSVVGRVISDEDIISLTLNDRDLKLSPDGIFRTKVVLANRNTPVDIIAVDRLGRSASAEFVFEFASIESDTKLATDKIETNVPKISIPRDEFGRYFALVIGNNDYKHLPKLQTAVPDANAIGRILEGHYGFKVVLLVDGTRYDILSALNDMREQLVETDNLLIYYAGHGVLDDVNQRGNWLPVDAEPDNTANWISNTSITDVLNAMSARHVLVVADSCYSGALTRSALTRISAGMTPESKKHWVRQMLAKRSRTALTSGGLAPVLDAGGGDHSIFAKSFLSALKDNRQIIEGQALHGQISARVAYAAEAFKFEQLPEYAPIRFAGHEAGDFFFVPSQID